jgi:hypothetical protein
MDDILVYSRRTKKTAYLVKRDELDLLRGHDGWQATEILVRQRMKSRRKAAARNAKVRIIFPHRHHVGHLDRWSHCRLAMASSFLSSASLLVGLQLLSRSFTFGLNQALLRFVSPQAFGTAAIQFDLLLSTILFLSREGVRNSLLRVWPSPTSTKQQATPTVPITVTNVAALPLILGVPLALGLPLVYLLASSTSTTSQPFFGLSVALYALSAIIELASEPMHIRSGHRMDDFACTDLLSVSGPWGSYARIPECGRRDSALS